MRLAPDLSIDTGFADQGRRMIDIGPAEFQLPYAGQLLPDGRMLLLTYRFSTGDDYSVFGIVRLLPDGTLDPTFGIGGHVVLDLPPLYFVSQLAPDTAGRIVYAGTVNSGRDWVVGRLLADGSEDFTFNAPLGRRIFGFSYVAGGGANQVGALRLQPDGRILVGGSAQRATGPTRDYLAVVRLHADGQFDNSFAGDGITVGTYADVPYTNNSDGVSAMLLDAGNRLMIAGSGLNTAGGRQFGIARIATGLAVDPVFGNGFEVAPLAF
jgi:uncharacterized delta-60 repeat protein